MRPVICFGEALIDFLHIGQETQDGITLPNYRQYPGGAPANASVAIAKLGGQSYFAGQVGSDSFGRFLTSALENYGVNTDYLLQHPSAKTAMAFVMLDQHGERSFEFYRENTADLLFTAEQASPNWFSQGGILHICSNTLTTPDGAAATGGVVTLAKAQDCLVSFDVNLRDNLWPGNTVDTHRVNQLAKQCDLIKFSLEELQQLAGNNVDTYLNDLFRAGVNLVLVTDGPRPVNYYTQTGQGTVTPPPVNAVDTNASGDTFIGGFLRCLAEDVTLTSVTTDRPRLEAIIEFATQCSAFTVGRPGAFTAMPGYADVAEFWPLG